MLNRIEKFKELYDEILEEIKKILPIYLKETTGSSIHEPIKGFKMDKTNNYEEVIKVITEDCHHEEEYHYIPVEYFLKMTEQCKYYHIIESYDKRPIGVCSSESIKDVHVEEPEATFIECSKEEFELIVEEGGYHADLLPKNWDENPILKYEDIVLWN